MKKPITKKLDVVPYEFTGDITQFRLVAEPTLDAIKNDIQKFYEATTRGADVMMLGRFLLGVSLIKAKKLVGNAKRGVHGGGDSGWLAWKREAFPGCSNNALTDAVNFTNEVFEEWRKSQNLQMQILEPLAFQTPENPAELKGLLTAIHNSMNGKKMTAFCRGIGRIREAIPPGANSNGRGPAKDSDGIDDETDFIDNVRADLVDLCDEDDDSLPKYPALKRDKLETACRCLLQRLLEIKRTAAGQASMKNSQPGGSR